MVKRRGPDDDRPRLDEEFVRGGPVELTATQRAIEQARQAAAERARALREEQFQAVASARQTSTRRARAVTGRVGRVVVVLAAVSGGGWWIAGHPGWRRSTPQPEPASQTLPAGETLPVSTTLPASTSQPSGSPSTTVVSLGNFRYAPGTCVTWNQANGGYVDTKQVPCSQPHLVEVVAEPFQITGFGTAYPSEAALDSYLTKQCTAPAEKFLGYAIDPNGRFSPSAVRPQPDGWALGDRTAWCTLQAQATQQATPPGHLTPFSGEVKGANQELVYPVSVCGTDTAAPVDCAGSHTWQITGSVDVSGTASRPATSSAWQALVGTRCATIGLSFLGGSYPRGVQSAWLTLSATSWAAGERTVQCIVAHFPPDGGSSVASTGSLAGAGR